MFESERIFIPSTLAYESLVNKTKKTFKKNYKYRHMYVSIYIRYTERVMYAYVYDCNCTEPDKQRESNRKRKRASKLLYFYLCC